MKSIANIRVYLLSAVLLLLIFTSCKHERQDDIQKYHELVNAAELALCDEEYRQALDNYGIAFRKIKRPFGKDVYNAALAAQASGHMAERDQYLQQLINGSEDIAILKAIFLSNFMTVQEWKILESHKTQEYDAELRAEMEEMGNAIKDNPTSFATTQQAMNRILELSKSSGLPSHMEIGYSENLKTLRHHEVLSEMAQRRGSDKSVNDLESLLRKAVNEGRLDPELAILYLDYQNDEEKGNYTTYATRQYRHELLPDSMNSIYWVPNIPKADIAEINELRKVWFANSIEDIQKKAAYMNASSWPFLFTSVRKSVNELAAESTEEEAVEQYLLNTDGMKKLL
jgi:hypothetical protein